MKEREIRTEQKIQNWTNELTRLENIRSSVGAEALRKPPLLRYLQVIVSAEKIFKDAEKEGSKETAVLVQLGSALFCATTYESLAKHAEIPPYFKELLLDKAENWAGKLVGISNDFPVDETVHGSPVVWKLETARVNARLHERRTKNRENNLFEAARWYGKAIEVGEKKATSENEDVRYYAIGASGVALGELARVQDTLIHEFGSTEFTEQEVRRGYEKSVEMVWKLFNTKAENWDRIDTVFGRFLEYCKKRGITPPLYLFVSWKQLVDKYQKELQPRMADRTKADLIPSDYASFFSKV